MKLHELSRLALLHALKNPDTTTDDHTKDAARVLRAQKLFDKTGTRMRKRLKASPWGIEAKMKGTHNG